MSSRSVVVLAGFLALVCFGRGQPPETVLFAKSRSYRQTSASDPQFAGASAEVQVYFTATVPTGTTIQLRAPDGSVTSVIRASARAFGLLRTFTSISALDAAFPDGNYTLIVSGDSVSGSSTPLRLSAGSGIQPVKVRNFDALQATRDSPVRVEWEPVASIGPNDESLRFSLLSPSGQLLFYTYPDVTATSLTIPVTSMPPAVTHTGELVGQRLEDYYANGDATVVLTGSAFAMRFPLQRLEEPPGILYHPRSTVLQPGSNAFISVTASGASSYQWKKDGVVIPGATNSGMNFPSVRASDAGTYTVDVINTAGRLTSNPANVLVAPTFALAILAGQAESSNRVDGDLTSARFRTATSLAIDAAGTLFVIDGHAIRKIAGNSVTTLAGGEQSGYVDGAGVAARFAQPGGIAVDAAGTVYVADTGNRVIRRITAAGVVSTLAGRNGEFSNPIGIAVDAAGNVAVGDDRLRQVFRVTPAGLVSVAYQRAPLTDGRTSRPIALAFDRAGNVFVGDAGTGEITSVSPAGVATLFAGAGRLESGNVGTSIATSGVNGITFDAAGNLYAYTNFEDLWMITPGRTGTRLASIFFVARGGTTAGPIAVDAAGTLYLACNTTITKATVTRNSTNPGIAITSSPLAQTVAAGDAVAFNVDASGPALSYQWLKDGVMIPGATNAFLLVRNVTQSADYSVMIANPIGGITSTSARATVVSTAQPGRLVNLSLRSNAGTGAGTLIMGFAIGGSATSGNRPLLLRGVGPGLRAFGLNNVLADPRLNVQDLLGATVASNDDWISSSSMTEATTAVGAFQLTSGGKDAAVLASLPPKAYTVQITGAGGTSGVALAEAYDTGGFGAGDSRLINVSARTLAGTGDNTLTAGFAIGGSTAKTVLIRAVGPSLGAFGISNTLYDPKLVLYSGPTKIAENDNWDGRALIPFFPTVGAFALGSSFDAALVATLRPGLYTVQVSGVPVPGHPEIQTDSGIALVEIYEVQ